MKWQDLSLALKLGVAFGFVLCMTVILGGGSYLGIRKIVTNAGEVINGNVIRADIASAEIAHLNWTKKVSSFLTANTGEELDVQVDDHLCAFGKWLYGEGRKEAEQMVPSLAPHLKKIEQIHHDLHLSAARIKESYHRSDPRLPTVLAEKEIDHLRFVNKVKDVFNGTAADFAVETNPRQCGLGKWLYGEGARKAIEGEPELKSAIEALMEPHVRLHESISDLKTLWNAGEEGRGRSREIFTTVTMPAFHQIEKGLSTIRKMAIRDLAGMERANEIYVTTTLPALNQVQEILGLVKQEVDSNMMSDTVMLNNATRTRTMLIVTSILTVFLGGFISFLTARKIAAPLIKGVNFADRIAAGDLSEKLAVEQDDEVGRLARALNGMSGNLKTIIGSIIEKSTQVSTSSDSLLDASAQMSSRAQELSEQAAATRTATEGVTGNIDQVAETGETMNAKARDIAETAAAMSENVNNVAAAIEQMSSSIQEVARNCSKAQEFAGNAKDKGNDSMVQIRELDQAARDIGNVINVITEITEQTKLLALNATIEAARAGDAGKGFAVVANEVKDLAKQTAEATEDIISQIQNMQARTGSVVEVIGEISGINEQVNEINTTIAAAVEEQTATVGEIARTIAGTAQGVEGVTGNIRELSVDIREKVITSISNAVSGAEDISTNINRISEICSSAAQSAVVVKDAAGELAGMAAGLKEQVSRFKLS